MASTYASMISKKFGTLALGSAGDEKSSKERNELNEQESTLIFDRYEKKEDFISKIRKLKPRHVVIQNAPYWTLKTCDFKAIAEAIVEANTETLSFDDSPGLFIEKTIESSGAVRSPDKEFNDFLEILSKSNLRKLSLRNNQLGFSIQDLSISLLLLQTSQITDLDISGNNLIAQIPYGFSRMASSFTGHSGWKYKDEKGKAKLIRLGKVLSHFKSVDLSNNDLCPTYITSADPGYSALTDLALGLADGTLQTLKLNGCFNKHGMTTEFIPSMLLDMLKAFSKVISLKELELGNNWLSARENKIDLREYLTALGNTNITKCSFEGSLFDFFIGIGLEEWKDKFSVINQMSAVINNNAKKQALQLQAPEGEAKARSEEQQSQNAGAGAGAGTALSGDGKPPVVSAYQRRTTSRISTLLDSLPEKEAVLPKCETPKPKPSSSS